MSNIVLHNLRFSNMFSYGANNYIELDKNRITQLTAVNGSGKSSLALIISELLFSKNVKGVKKGDILNRYGKDKSWIGELEFSVNEIQYRISVKRTGASTKVELYENGKDISEHKVADTYAKLQDLLGLTFETFSQITYQSSTNLLDFLNATDTTRKKFLIKLFNLEKYIAVGEQIKTKTSVADKELTKLQGELKSIEDFLTKTTIPDMLVEVEVPDIDISDAERLKAAQIEFASIDTTCKRIDQNLLYKIERNAIPINIGSTPPKAFEHQEELDLLLVEQNTLYKSEKEVKQALAQIDLRDKCPSCGQAIDNSHIVKMKIDLEAKLADITNKAVIINTRLVELKAEAKVIAEQERVYKKEQDSIKRFEQLSQLIDSDLPDTFPDKDIIAQEVAALTAKIAADKKAKQNAEDFNKRVQANNAKVEALIEQKSEFLIRQTAISNDILIKSRQVSALNILKKAFSPSGIVAFKLENLTKELETTINYYLSILSDGQFQVEFILDNEKLNINVINNGISSPIETTSGGEFSRIQTSVLLAIRNLLSSLGGSSINLLFLDEITGVLDDEGKEKLVEVLQREDALNVFLISHDFTHPLIDKVSIVKVDNISSIQG